MASSIPSPVVNNASHSMQNKESFQSSGKVAMDIIHEETQRFVQALYE